MYEWLMSISSIVLIICTIAKLLHLHNSVQNLGKTLEHEIWNIKSKGSIWEDCFGNILILPNAKGANRAYLKYNGYAHECSKLETFYLRMMARKALEERKKRKCL